MSHLYEGIRCSTRVVNDFPFVFLLLTSVQTLNVFRASMSFTCESPSEATQVVVGEPRSEGRFQTIHLREKFLSGFTFKYLLRLSIMIYIYD